MNKPLLIERTIDNVDVFFAPNSMWLSGHAGLEVFRQGIILRYLKNNRHADIIDAYAKKNNLSGIGILSAHFEVIDNRWQFSDSKKFYSVQSWINANDGKYAALMMDSNSERTFVRSNESMLMFTAGDFSVVKQVGGDEPLELYIPKVGMIDNYTLDSYIEKYIK